MMKGFLKDYSPGMQFLFVMLVFVASWLIFQIIAIVSGVAIYGISIKEITISNHFSGNPRRNSVS